MPRRATGSAFFSKGSYFARVTIAAKERRAFRLPSIGDDAAARERADALAQLAADLRAAGVARELVQRLVAAGAGARSSAELGEVLETGRRVAAGELRPRPTNATTFRELGAMWTSGELHRRWPDHVRLKRTAHRDAALLEARVYPIVGGVRLVDFTLEHAETVMRSLPKMERATRRQYAQAIARVLTLAAYPARVIPRSPLPRGFVPPVRASKAKSYLYPAEDRALLACAAVPLGVRLLYGFLAREGMRAGEAGALQWRDVDFVVGTVRLDTNKTDDPRAWPLDAGVLRALARWHELRGAPEAEELVFGGLDFDWGHAARAFRGHLEAAGVTRPDLFEKSAARLRVRLHDLRGTFVTLSLANGRTETWVADRTGHKSSVMINAYRRAARTAAELGLGGLDALDVAIPELGGPSGGERAAERAAGEVEGSRRVAYPSEIADQSRAGGMAYAGDLKSLAPHRA